MMLESNWIHINEHQLTLIVFNICIEGNLKKFHCIKKLSKNEYNTHKYTNRKYKAEDLYIVIVF